MWVDMRVTPNPHICCIYAARAFCTSSHVTTPRSNGSLVFQFGAANPGGLSFPEHPGSREHPASFIETALLDIVGAVGYRFS